MWNMKTNDIINLHIEDPGLSALCLPVYRIPVHYKIFCFTIDAYYSNTKKLDLAVYGFEAKDRRSGPD